MRRWACRWVCASTRAAKPVPGPTSILPAHTLAASYGNFDDEDEDDEDDDLDLDLDNETESF